MCSYYLFSITRRRQRKCIHFSARLLFKAQRWLAANSESKCSMPMHIHMFNTQTCIPNDVGEDRMQ